MSGIDFSKIKSEINNRKQQDIVKAEQSGRMPKNMLIHGLLNASKTGIPNEATQLIKAVSMVSEGKKVVGDSGVSTNQMNLPPIEPRKQKNNVNEVINYPKPTIENNYGMMPERQPLNNIEMELNRRRNEYESQGIKTDAWGIPLQNQQPVYQQQYNPQMGGVNADALQGLVFELMDKYLKDKMVPLMKDVLKNTIVDQYTNSVVKNNILQNEEAIEDILKKLIKKMSQNKK